MLRKLEFRDVEGMQEWMKDDETMECFRLERSQTKYEEVYNFIVSARRDFDDCNSKSRHYAIEDASGNYLGTISLKNIDQKNRNAEYAIVLRKHVRGNNIALDATYELLDLAFCELNLMKVYLNVYSDNWIAIRFYEKVGFQYEGEFRNHILVGDRFKSLKWYSLMCDEYTLRKR